MGATTKFRDLVLERIHLEREHMEAARDQLMKDLNAWQSAVTEQKSYGQLLKMVA